MHDKIVMMRWCYLTVAMLTSFAISVLSLSIPDRQLWNGDDHSTAPPLRPPPLQFHPRSYLWPVPYGPAAVTGYGGGYGHRGIGHIINAANGFAPPGIGAPAPLGNLGPGAPP